MHRNAVPGTGNVSVPAAELMDFTIYMNVPGSGKLPTFAIVIP